MSTREPFEIHAFRLANNDPWADVIPPEPESSYLPFELHPSMNVRDGLLEPLITPDLQDVFAQVLSLLDPVDILALGRALPRARKLLDDYPHVWRNAFAAASLPPVPDDLQAHQYASLVFDQHCHFCGTVDAGIHLWSIRKRSCSTCIGSSHRFVSQSRLLAHEQTTKLLPLLRRVTQVCELRLSTEPDPHADESDDDDNDNDDEDLHFYRPGRIQKKRYFLAVEVNDMLAAVSKLGIDKVVEEREVLLKNHALREKQAVMYVPACQWQRNMRRAREIYKELTLRGHGLDLACTHPFDGHNMFWSAGPDHGIYHPGSRWTDATQHSSGWRTYLDLLMEKMECISSQRCQLAQQKAYRQRIFTVLQYAQGCPSVEDADLWKHPSPFDILKYHAIDMLVNRPIDYDPSGRYQDAIYDTVTDAELHDAVDAAYLAAADWNEERKQALVERLLDENKRASENGMSLLNLAITFWKCDVCSSRPNGDADSHMLSTKELLAHRCQQRTLAGVSSTPLRSEWGHREVRVTRDDERGYHWMGVGSLPIGQWDLPVFPLDPEDAPTPPSVWFTGRRDRSFELHEQALATASSILEAAGLDRRTTTSSDMHEVSLLHKNCMFSSETIFTWNGAVRHCLAHTCKAWSKNVPSPGWSKL